MKDILHSKYSPIFIVGLCFFVIGAVFSVGYHWPDEHYQILEFCNYLMGKSQGKDLPWEFHASMRPALQVYLAFGIIKLSSLAGITNPFVWAFILRLLSALLAWFIICKLCILLADDFNTETGRKLFIGLNLLLWFVPYIYVRFSSENYGALALLYALYILMKYFKEKSANSFWPIFISGVLLGVSFFMRYQMAFAIIGLAAWLLFVKKMEFKLIVILCLGVLFAMVISIYLDCLFYKGFTLTPYNYFHGNIIEDRVSDAGVSPWWWYLSSFIVQGIPPLSILLLFLFGIGIYQRPKNIFTFLIVPFLLIHIIIGHKEMRFLFPMAFVFLYLVAIGADTWFANNGNSKGLKYIFFVLIFINVPMLLFRTFSPAQEAINCYRFLYDYAAKDSVNILCKNRSVYDLIGAQVNFYKSPYVHVIMLKTDSAITNYMHTHNTKGDLVFSERISIDSSFAHYPNHRLYCLFPEWLLKYNINNWENRARIWSIYKLETQ